MAPELRLALAGARSAFVPRARWVLETLAESLGHAPTWVEGDADADLVYAPEAPTPGGGVWIPAEEPAQGFFEGSGAVPGPAVHRASGLTLLFPPSRPGAAIPGDLVASAFYLLARWDELRTRTRDRFGRLPLTASAFGRIAGLRLDDPPVEGYLTALRRELGLPAPTRWRVALTHDIDRIRRRTARGAAGTLRRGGPRALARLALRDPWRNLPDLLSAAAGRGLAPTVFLIGRNAHRLDGTPRRAYERERPRMAAAVRAAGGEVGLHAAFASSESADALAAELAGLRAETGLPGLGGVRFHYLRFTYHGSVRGLEAAGVSYDASLGFSEAPGFAAGIARPFRPYLVGEERPARLRLVPLAVMDTSLWSHGGLDAGAARARALAVLDRVRVAGGEAALLWHNTALADPRAPGYGPLWGELLDELAARGAELGPIVPPAAPRPARLDGVRALHLTSVHRPRDVRIFHKEARALAGAGARAEVLAPRTPVRRARRLAAGGRLVRAARARDADVYHLHDPELLPWGLVLARATGRPVVYDAHEYLGQTVRTKRWLPARARRPLAWAAERAERRGARSLAAVVAVNPDLAARFAAAGARAVSVANSPWSGAFPPPGALPAEPVALYVGGLGPLRGRDLMRAAFPLVQTPGARLVLAGPGDPGALPPGVEHLGAVDHAAVPGLLAGARVAWIPLQRHGNYDRAVPTKLVEAMAAGRPVVASDLGRMGALVRAAGCGLLVAPDDPRAHARALDRLLGGSDEAARLGAAGRRAFLDGLAFEREAAALTRLYADLTEGR